jgi:hypothetical protein
MEELTFQMIEDDVTGAYGDLSHDEMLEHATASVSAHLADYWVPSLAFNKRNRAAVAAIVADILIDHTRWFVERATQTEDQAGEHKDVAR